MSLRDGAPIWLDVSNNTTLPLSRVNLQRSNGAAAAGYDEAWLQEILYRHPEVLPIEQIRPGFGRIIPLCRELPLLLSNGQIGYLDNLYITGEGRLVLVEAKLWRNPEARRSAIAQALEYAGALFRLRYEELQAAVLDAKGKSQHVADSLHEIVARHHHVDEQQFVDAVSRNLHRGRAIIAVVGDGIREELASIAELLQSHAGHRFTFALIELRVFEAPGSVRLICPSTLAQTTLIERGVIQIQDENLNDRRIVVRPTEPPVAAAAKRPTFGIEEDEFYEVLDQKYPGASDTIKRLLTRAAPLGIYADWQGGLNLRHAASDGGPMNLGVIEKGGVVDTGPATFGGRAVAAREYNETLARLVGGKIVEFRNGQEFGLRTSFGKMPRVTDLLPQHQEGWLAAMTRYIERVLELAKSKERNVTARPTTWEEDAIGYNPTTGQLNVVKGD